MEDRKNRRRIHGSQKRPLRTEKAYTGIKDKGDAVV